jgi:hypothetical protein
MTFVLSAVSAAFSSGYNTIMPAPTLRGYKGNINHFSLKIFKVEEGKYASGVSASAVIGGICPCGPSLLRPRARACLVGGVQEQPATRYQ